MEHGALMPDPIPALCQGRDANVAFDPDDRLGKRAETVLRCRRHLELDRGDHL